MEGLIGAVVAGLLALVGLRGAAKFASREGGRAAVWYRDASYPWYLRNLGFMQLPGGVMFALWAAAMALFATGAVAGALIGLSLVSLSGIAGILAVVWGWSPPAFLKPVWLREEETVVGPPPRTRGSMRFVGWLALIIGLVASASVALGPPVLVLLELR